MRANRRVGVILLALWLLLPTLPVFAAGMDTAAAEEVLALPQFPSESYATLSIQQQERVIRFYALAKKECQHTRLMVLTSISFYKQMNGIEQYSRHAIADSDFAYIYYSEATLAELADTLMKVAPQSARQALPELGRAAEWDGKAQPAYAAIARGKKCFALGRDKYKHQDYAGAVTDFSEALQVFSRDAYRWRYRGMAYLWQRKYEEAIADFSQAISIDPQNGHFFAERAAVFQLWAVNGGGAERREQAEDDYAQAQKLLLSSEGEKGLAWLREFQKSTDQLEAVYMKSSLASIN